MTFDYVIVGGGSAGCVMAARLSEDANVAVCLLEAGGGGKSILVRAPALVAAMVSGRPKINNWVFKTTPQAGLHGRRGFQPRGRALGGSSAINAMLYLRGHRRDYDEWADLGCDGWSWDEVLPYFKRSEDYVEGPSEMHGAGGEWRVENQRLHWDVLDHWMMAATAWGLPEVTDFNTGNNEGVGYFRVNQRGGWRINTAKAFLRTNTGAHLKVETKAHTSRVLINHGRAVGVEYIQHGETKTAHARGEERRIASRKAAAGGHHAPHRDARNDEVPAVIAVGDPCERQAEQRIEKREGQSDQQADLRVRDIERRADRCDQEAEDHPVDKRQRIGQQQYRDDIPAIGRPRPGRRFPFPCTRLPGRIAARALARHILSRLSLRSQPPSCTAGHAAI